MYSNPFFSGKRVLRVAVVTCFIVAYLSTVYAFTLKGYSDDFLKQLGFTKSAADETISKSILGGYLATSDLKTAKNIALGNRTEVTLDLLSYVKKFVRSEAFKQQYETLRNENKPEPEVPQSPADMKKEYIESLKQTLAETEKSVKTASPDIKPALQNMIKETKKMIADAERPDNSTFKMYESSYADLLAEAGERNAESLKQWQEQYPLEAEKYLKPLLKEFLEDTEGIDFNAELVTKRNKKFFVNPAYEKKNNKWKMGFRAGKEVLLPAREFVTRWIAEIK